ncbi:MAG: ribonuclease P protein component [Syntrophus sp. (in: bacteria)]
MPKTELCDPALASAYPMENSTFGKLERIRKRREYLAIYQRGVRKHSEHFTCIVSPNPSGVRRLGITIVKKVGNAVTRNRIKRLIREFYRLHKPRLPASLDIVIMVKVRAALPTRHDVQRELERLLVRTSDE